MASFHPFRPFLLSDLRGFTRLALYPFELSRINNPLIHLDATKSVLSLCLPPSSIRPTSTADRMSEGTLQKLFCPSAYSEL